MAKVLAKVSYTETALTNSEGVLASNGALAIETGKRTGRSPKARYIVQDIITETSVAWGPINRPMTTDKFNSLWDKAIAYKADKETHTQDLSLGHDSRYAIGIKTETELAAHALFLKNMFIDKSLDSNGLKWQLLSLANMELDPATEGLEEDGLVAINFAKRKVLICGMRYSGEMKKSLFSVLNFILPETNVLPMHCAASADKAGNTALFFGLSGTGKTTLSADPKRLLIGDDEHGWSDSGIFNFEGGCYAKCYNLSPEQEPLIWQAIRPGALLENVVLDSNLSPDYSDDSKTKNSRVAYPLSFIEQRVNSGCGQHPTAVIFLTCDLFGVLPAVSLLDNAQAAYYFLSGYTALVGSTEMGSGSDIAPTFSACFGAPFFARPSEVYAELLQKRLTETGAQVLLVNTGWFGGRHGAKSSARYPINITRQVVNAALDTKIDPAACWQLPGFNFMVPNALTGVDSKWLDPRLSWNDADNYNASSHELQQAFANNMRTMNVSSNIMQAGPNID